MPKSRIIIFIGTLVALLPVLGFPHAWESFFQVVAGLSIILLSIWTTIDKRLTLKAKAQRRQADKLREQEIEGANTRQVESTEPTIELLAGEEDL